MILKGNRRGCRYKECKSKFWADYQLSSLTVTEVDLSECLLLSFFIKKFSVCEHAQNTWLLYKTSSHYSMIFPTF